jgi:SAM-dependent methyltransferase
VDKHSPLPATYAGVFCISCAALATQVALVRVLSISLWHHFAYLVIGIALLGFAAAGAVLTASGQLTEGGLQPALARRARYAALFTLCAILVAAVIRCNTLDLLRDPSVAVGLLCLIVVCALPFFGAGLVIATALSGVKERAGAVYAADLLGAATGAAVTLPLLERLGAVGVIFGAAVLCAVSALLFSLGGPRRELLRSGGVLAAALVAALALGSSEAWINPAPSKEIRHFYNPDAQKRDIELTRWSAQGRIDVSKELLLPPIMGASFGKGNPAPLWPGRAVTQDGAAPTVLYRYAINGKRIPFLKHNTSAAVWELRGAQAGRGSEVLVIGVGGGIDLQIAKTYGAARVTGVEINPVMLDLLRQHYPDFTGKLHEQPGVTLVQEEGRAFLRASTARYDVIQLSGVDTFTALSHGAQSVAEAYLYTLEAFEDYLDHLRPDGCLSMSRLILPRPRETLRLAYTAAEALARRGVKRPGEQIFILRGRGKGWASLLVCQRPLERAGVERLRAFAQRENFAVIFDPLTQRGEGPFYSALHDDPVKRAAFAAGYQFLITPATDDTPFFFDYFRWSNLSELGQRTDPGAMYAPAVPIGHAVVLTALVLTTLLAVIGILLPLRRLDRQRTDPPRQGRRRHLLYFAGLGLAFILVEVTFLQRLTFLLGHPSYALSVVLAVLLLSSGLGAALSRRLPLDGRLWAALPYLLAALLAAAAIFSRLLLPDLLQLSFGGRLAVSVLLLAPLGLLMGIPFPAGIQQLQRSAPALVPWAFGVNGFFTVIATGLSTVIALQTGYTLLLGLAALVYWVVLRFFRPRPAPD